MIVQVDRTLDRTVDQSNSSSVSQLGLGLQKRSNVSEGGTPKERGGRGDQDEARRVDAS